MPSLPVPRWKDSSLSMGGMLRASGAKAERESILSWNLPSRSMNWVKTRKSIQLSTSSLNEPSNRLRLNARRSRSFCASRRPDSPKW